MLPGDFTEASGYRAGLQLAALSARPSAVFAANDMTALGCLGALREAGQKVPQDIALAGFDDVPIARHVQPALTTVRMPIVELGTLALEVLAAAIESPDGPVPPRQTFRAELMVRQSCHIHSPAAGRPASAPLVSPDRLP